ncbi:hypothetical protein JM18_004535 [Phytophthora kernoviae]|uniref:Translin n=2 Tax=Phytophthora kernoviae TaxID=325452 RepID=A0A8T0M0A2_9STRA|nr:hypothetical protein G195_005113 [Phytophthora kernoviae 00238/432]KAG2523997.1 hypothetical protein JM18_004535 [Phytophthora kernoviae]KAG2524357.1 hypothetical protein JM16_005010 [Phytophthora kernoviae]
MKRMRTSEPNAADTPLLNQQDFVDMNRGVYAHTQYDYDIDVIPELVELTKQNPSLRDGALSSSLEEYAEAKCFFHYLDTRCLLPRQDVPILKKNEYLGGVIDFTGELMRLAVVKATSRDVQEVERCKAMVEAISGELIQFDFRNGPMRRKFDSVKYNLRKLENTLYELSLVTNSGLALQAHSVQEAPAASTHTEDE